MKAPTKKKTVLQGCLLLILMVSFFFFFGISGDEAQAQTVRGKLYRQGTSGSFPAPYIRLTLFAEGKGRSSPVYSGSDGAYFFHDISAGDYTLEVWLDPQKPTAHRVRVLNQRYTDVNPIRIP
jgi:hypothetical protein